jgi:hypothetical protein
MFTKQSIIDIIKDNGYCDQIFIDIPTNEPGKIRVLLPYLNGNREELFSHISQIIPVGIYLELIVFDDNTKWLEAKKLLEDKKGGIHL